MHWQSRKLTRRSLLRRLGAGAVVVAAGATLFNEKAAFAAAAPAAAAERRRWRRPRWPRPERAGTLMTTSIESSGADDDMRRFADEGARASAENAMTLAEGLAAHELLRPEISVQRAADVLFTVVSPQVYSMLRRQCGWDVDEYRNWVKATIRANLLH